MNNACPCRKQSCPRRGDCAACRAYHAGGKRLPRYERHPVRTAPVTVLAVLAGSVIYRLFYVAALRFNFPAEYIKLLSAIIVALAIAAPTLKKWAAFQGRKSRARQERRNGNA